MMCACIGKHALSDLYYEYVDCSNACRVAYLSKVEITEKYKARVNKITTNKVSSAMDQAMDKLSREMALLMEQDVSLTRQLLTLNETIEDLKNKKKYGYFFRPTSVTSSDDLLER